MTTEEDSGTRVGDAQYDPPSAEPLATAGKNEPLPEVLEWFDLSFEARENPAFDIDQLIAVGDKLVVILGALFGFAQGRVSDVRERAEALWEELGGELCVCQSPDVPHWCEDCQRMIDTIGAAFIRASAANHGSPTIPEQPRAKRTR